jgi:hypothetical protein
MTSTQKTAKTTSTFFIPSAPVYLHRYQTGYDTKGNETTPEKKKKEKN